MMTLAIGVGIGLVIVPLARAITYHIQQRRESKVDVLSSEWKWKMVVRERQEGRE